MVVNSNKTGILCISDVLSYRADTFVEDADGQRLGKVPRLKILGYMMGERPGAHVHVETI